MSANDLRKHIHTLVEQVPENYLEQVTAFLTSLSEDRSFAELGCSAEEYNLELNAALARHLSGHSVPHSAALNSVRERIRKYGTAD